MKDKIVTIIKKPWFRLLLIVLFFSITLFIHWRNSQVVFASTVNHVVGATSQATEQLSEVPQLTVDEIVNNHLPKLKMDTLQDILKNKDGSVNNATGNLNLSSTFTKIVTGKLRLSTATAINFLQDYFFMGIRLAVMSSFSFIVVSLLSQLLNSLLPSKDDLTKKMINFTVTATLIGSVITFMTLNIAQLNTIYTGLVKALNLGIPILSGLMLMTGYTMSSMVFVSSTLTELSYALNLTLTYVFPILTIFLCATVLLKSTGHSMTKLYLTINKFICYFYNIIFGVNLLILGFYKTTLPIIDSSVKTGTRKILLNFIPIAGDVLDSTLDTFASVSCLVKNSYIWVFLLVVLILILPKIIEQSLSVIVYKFLGGTLELLGDTQLSETASLISVTQKTLLRCTSVICVIVATTLLAILSVGTP